MEAEKGRSSLLSRRRQGRILSAAFFALALAVAASGQTPGGEPVSVLGVKNPFLLSAANDAVSLALKKLESPGCQQIFTDFRDGAGRPLQARLDALDHTGASFLRILRFANGERLSPCQSRGILAATTPTSHVIFLCGIQFFEKEHRDPEFAAALVIHEMLHSLGLRENPPASNEITARVVERCGPLAAGEGPTATALVK
ncbi:MAG: hypothetical protein ACRD3M_19130 [Thermoanaerobaculia bacterium]